MPESKSRALYNPNYASVRCIQPMPGMIQLHHNQTNPNQNQQNHRLSKSNEIEEGNYVNVDSPRRFVIEPDISNTQETQYVYASDTPTTNAEHIVPAPENGDSNQRVSVIHPVIPENNGFYENVNINMNQNANKSQSNPADANGNPQDENTEKLLQDHDQDKEMFDYMQFEEAEQGENHGNKKESTASLTWKGKMRNFLHSKPCHIAVIVLVLIDTILVITEILLDLKIVEVGEDSEAPEIVHYCSITILSIFMLEILAKVVADWHHFITHKIEVLDAFVVIVAFGFDIGMLFIDNDALVAVGLLVLLRLWRVVRIINGVILSVKTECDERVHALKAKLQDFENQMKETEENSQKEIERLKKILVENGIHIEDERQEAAAEPTNGAVVKLTASDNMISIDT